MRSAQDFRHNQNIFKTKITRGVSETRYPTTVSRLYSILFEKKFCMRAAYKSGATAEMVICLQKNESAKDCKNKEREQKDVRDHNAGL
jgi:hypothetical protein